MWNFRETNPWNARLIKALAKRMQHVGATLLHATCIVRLATVLHASFTNIKLQSNIVQHHAAMLHSFGQGLHGQQRIQFQFEWQEHVQWYRRFAGNVQDANLVTRKDCVIAQPWRVVTKKKDRQKEQQEYISSEAWRTRVALLAISTPRARNWLNHQTWAARVIESIAKQIVRAIESVTKHDSRTRSKIAKYYRRA